MLLANSTERKNGMVLAAGLIALITATSAAQHADWPTDEHVTYEVWYDPAGWFVVPGDHEIQRAREDYDMSASQDPMHTANHRPHHAGDHDADWDDRPVQRTIVRGDEMFDAVHTGTHYVWNSRTKEWDRQDVSFWDKYHYYTVDYDGDKRSDESERAAINQNEYLFHGQLVDTHRVPIRGEKDHMVAKVVAPDGRVIVANLGPDLDLDGLDVNPGDAITIRGRKGTIDNKLVILTTQISAHDTLRLTRAEHIDWLRIDQRVTQSDRIHTSDDHWIVVAPQDDWLRDQEWLRVTSAPNTAAEAHETFTGTIQDARRISVNGVEHTFVRISQPQGQVRTIDIGPWLTLSDLNLNLGDRITVAGVHRHVEGAPVYVVRHLRNDNMMLTVSEPATAFMTPTRPDGQTVVRGIVQDFRTMRIAGDLHDHTLVKLRREDGQMAIVDLGPHFPLHDLDAYRNRSSEFVVRGDWKQVNGQPVLVARELSADGETILLSAARPTR